MKLEAPSHSAAGKLALSRCGLALLSLLAGAAQAQTPPADNAVPPANMSRLLGGAKIEALDSGTGATTPMPGISAVIDDDASSGWTPPVGKSMVLVTLPQEADLDSFTLFAPGAKGTYKAFAADSPAAAYAAANGGANPTFAGDLGQRTAASAGATPKGRYVVVTLDLETTAPLRSLDAIGKPSSGANNSTTVVSPASGEQNSGTDGEGNIAEVNFAAKALGAKPAADIDPAAEALIDGDTASSNPVAPKQGEDQARVVFSLGAAVEVKRVSLAFGEVEGEVVFIATDAEHPTGRELGKATLDGTGKTLTLDVPGITAESVIMEWRPKQPGTPLVVSELGVFALARVVRLPGGLDKNLPSMQLQVTPPPPPPAPPAPPPPVAPPPPILPPPEPVSG